ncbi:NAD(P)H azoreductase-like [Paramacrobiotus metropolitanus]|uniref:NAD(P)H azoreductase-like n=1 Tax=Paramacrobiotus metropolitanus TaxID=2943436 RepID=UPI0024458DBD|nr:NAD(P)H azoreductase-like [Paramacrobiotus metropolitanus]
MPCGHNKKPVILVLGCTGTNGSQIVANLEKFADDVTVRYSSRRQDQVDKWKKEKKDAVLLDLDEPRTFGLALNGVDRVMLITGYTVAMLQQSKTLIDAAYKAGVQHVVHLGIFADWDTTDPHYCWHQLIEAYLKASGMKWTNLHNNVFMENMFTFIHKGTVNDFFDGERVGWISAEDIAKTAATVLREGPCKHHGKDYWLSEETMNLKQVTEIISQVTGKQVQYAQKTAADFNEMMKYSQMEQWYAKGLYEFFIQVKDGRMGLCSAVRNDVPVVTGENALTIKEWATKNKEALLKTLQ